MATTTFIKVDFDMEAAKKALTSFKKQQFPFAYAKSLTETAEAARQGIGMQSRRVFKLHTEFIPRNVKKSSAMKSDIKLYGYAEAAVFTGKRLDEWMGLHEEGGIKKPAVFGSKDTGRKLTIPGKGLKTKAFKTRTGKVRARWKPKRLLENYRGVRGGRTMKVRRGGQKKTPFIIRTKSNDTPILVRRVSKKRYPLEVLYVFVDDAKISDRWRFAPTVRKVANFVFEKKFRKNLKMAIEKSR